MGLDERACQYPGFPREYGRRFYLNSSQLEILDDDDLFAHHRLKRCTALAPSSTSPNSSYRWNQTDTIAGYADGKDGDCQDGEHGVHVAPPEREWVDDEFKKKVE